MDIFINLITIQIHVKYYIIFLNKKILFIQNEKHVYNVKLNNKPKPRIPKNFKFPRIIITILEKLMIKTHSLKLN